MLTIDPLKKKKKSNKLKRKYVIICMKFSVMSGNIFKYLQFKLNLSFYVTQLYIHQIKFFC